MIDRMADIVGFSKYFTFVMQQPFEILGRFHFQQRKVKFVEALSSRFVAQGFPRWPTGGKQN